jgi:hypothetical protein
VFLSASAGPGFIMPPRFLYRLKAISNPGLSGFRLLLYRAAGGCPCFPAFPRHVIFFTIVFYAVVPFFINSTVTGKKAAFQLGAAEL